MKMVEYPRNIVCMNMIEQSRTINYQLSSNKLPTENTFTIITFENTMNFA